MFSRSVTAFALALLMGAWGCAPPASAPAPETSAAGAPSSSSPEPSPAVREPEKRTIPSTTAAQDEPSPTATPDELIGRAEKTLQTGDLAKGIALLERALDVDPKNRKALYLLAILTHQRAISLERPQSSPLQLQAAATIRRL